MLGFKKRGKYLRKIEDAKNQKKSAITASKNTAEYPKNQR